ncbi:hypothetical protein B6S12_09210 [Helicobacter valdiviensis]|uniref:Uncharacterized protein n=1 Tax=Helicobacter valdiviensis TaxID=1458358 RepID=A0A2W6PL68_9HELI|nr:hypothetical protein B6S12_09210 [Helicobacter valdiviensis]
MRKLKLFTFDLLYHFIISTSQSDELRYKQDYKSNLFPLYVRIFHPLLLCLRTLSVSKFFENIVKFSRHLPVLFFNPLKYPILLFKGKMPC